MLKHIGDGLSGIGKRLGGDDEAKAYLEEFEKFDHVHTSNAPFLGTKAGIVASSQKSQLYVTEKLFAHNVVLAEVGFTTPLSKAKDTFKVVANKKTIIGKTANVKDRVIVCSQDGHVMAVIVQDVHVSTQCYFIFGTKPCSFNQRPSDKYHHEGKALFAYGKINTAGKKYKNLAVDTYQEGGFEFESLKTEPLEMGGVLAEKPLLVSHKGKPAAVLRQGQFPDDIATPAWSASVAPGIDPLMVLCMIAVMDTQII